MAAHRYWRLNISAVDGGAFIDFSEIELRGSVGGPDLTGSGTVSVYSEWPGQEGTKSVDDNTSTFWGSYPANPPGWWAYDFGAGNDQDIVQLYITPRASYPQDGPAAFDLQFSDNGSDWTTAESFTAAWEEGVAQTFTIEEEGSGDIDIAIPAASNLAFTGYAPIVLVSLQSRNPTCTLVTRRATSPPFAVVEMPSERKGT